MNCLAFLEWLDEVKGIQSNRAYHINQWAQDHHQPVGDWDGYIKFLRRYFLNLSNAPSDFAAIQINGVGSRKLELFPEGKSAGNFLCGLNIISQHGPTTLKDFRVKNLEFNGQNMGMIEVSNLWIDSLFVNVRTGGNYVFHNCFIGTLKLTPHAANDFEMRGGIILGIECPAPVNEGPFTGSVFFDRRIKFPRTPGLRMRGAQNYRNLRAHLIKLENAPMASFFHSLEQQMDRSNQSPIDRTISNIYWLLSDYGSSTVRPLLWIAILFFITFLLVFVSDGADTYKHDALKGWQSGLAGVQLTARLARSLVQTLGSTFNPIGIFGSTGLLVAKSGWLAAWLVVHGLLSALCFLLLVFALRRRFKIT